MNKSSNDFKIINSNLKKFSILLLNYNNFNYLFDMIDSIYNQSYDNIQLVITDDASIFFDKDKIINYINKKNKKIETSIYINEKNIGTVKTINKYLKKLTGDYYLITSSDDVLANNDVISNYIECFKNHNVRIITSQWIICDDNLHIIKNFIPNKKIEQYNANQNNILFDMCKSNRFGSGATVYKKELFENCQFDESYKYLEDWPFWLKQLFNHEKIYVASFDGLLHRSGGISETKIIKESTKQFFKELMETFHKEIIPNISNFNDYKQWSIVDSYKFYIEYYGKYIDTSFYKDELQQLLLNNYKIRIYSYLNVIRFHLIGKIIDMIKHRRIVSIAFILTIVISLLMKIYIDNNNLYLLFIIITYMILYIGLIIIKEIGR